MLLKIVKRPEPSRAMVYLTPILALILTMLTSMVVFTLMGVDPVEALRQPMLLILELELYLFYILEQRSKRKSTYLD